VAAVRIISTNWQKESVKPEKHRVQSKFAARRSDCHAFLSRFARDRRKKSERSQGIRKRILRGSAEHHFEHVLKAKAILVFAQGH
jgi:hypothetical protein